jgi:mono/diheme cytochrome c family protein
MKHHLKTFIVIAALAAFVSCRFYFDTTKDSFISHSNPTSVQNGKNLAHNVCGGCHYDHDVKKFIGKPMNDLPGIGGKIYSANLTQSATNGIPPKYSDAELFYLIKTGIARNGKFMPYMMKPMMADEDINDVIAYLHSNDPDVSAADTTVGLTHINLLGKMFIRIASKKPTPYNKGVVRPDENDAANYGRYLVAVVGCYHCHSSSLLHIDYFHPENSKGYMTGGAKFKSSDGKKIRASNLTPDNATGIGNFSSPDFTTAVKEGIGPGGYKLRVPMPKFRDLTDKQVQAIYAYIKTLQPVQHKVGTNP